LKDIENTYAKFQKEIRKIDEDTAVFVDLCSTGRLYSFWHRGSAFRRRRAGVRSRNYRI